MFKQITLATVVTLSAVGAAQASTVSGNFSGTIDAPSDASGSSIAYIGAGTSTLAWGTQSDGSSTVQTGDASSLTINSTSFDFDAVALSTGSILLGTITWDNQSNFSAGGDWTSAINLDINISAPSSVSLSETVAFGISNTTDTYRDTDENERLGTVPDLITGLILDADAFSAPIDLGNGYLINSLFFAEIGTGNTFNDLTGLWTNVEGGVSTIGIYAEVAPIPLPAGIWLMLGGLGSFAAIRRRKKAA
ncbi:choice-of-anchor K domain-containing protein [Roseobacter sp.]|uniref:choice-of-anchor K domain-containing protein n=1 Tax=Roseobacter sp. TaxID=1907202 RepID=UPI003296BEA4